MCNASDLRPSSAWVTGRARCRSRRWAFSMSPTAKARADRPSRGTVMGAQIEAHVRKLERGAVGAPAEQQPIAGHGRIDRRRGNHDVVEGMDHARVPPFLAQQESSHSLYHDCQAQGQGHDKQLGEKSQDRSSKARPQSPIGGSQARRAQAPPARDRRSRRGRVPCSAGTRPPTCPRAGRPRGPGRARRLSRLAHEKFTDPALGKLLDDLAALCRAPAARHRRRQPDPRRAPRLREGDQGAGRVRRPLERASAPPPTTPGRGRARPTTSPPCVRCSRRRSTSAAEYADFFAPYAHIADPLIDGADEGMTTASVPALFAELRARAGADRARHRRAAAGRRQLPARRVSARRRSWRSASPSSSASATTSTAAGSTRRTIRSAPSSRPATCASPRACARTTSARRCSPRCTRPATRSTSRASTPRSRARRSARAPRPACTRASRGCGRTWSAAAAASGSISIRSCATPFPDQFDARAARDLLSRHQQGRALADPHRRRRGDLQSARHAALRPGAGRCSRAGSRSRTCPRPGARAIEADFGIAPPDDRDGCLQDVHWYGGGDRRRLPGLHHRQHPERAVLRRRAQGASRDPARDGAAASSPRCTAGCASNLYRHGRKFTPDELVERATGGPMSIAPYIAYLRAKYGELYRLPPAPKR